MPLGDSSPFAPIDLVGGLVTNVVATNMACQNHSFRTGISLNVKDASGKVVVDGNNNPVKEVPAYLDYRFLGGMAAAVAGQLVPNAMARRVSHDLASGLLNSYVATETCRRHALQRVTAEEWASPSAEPDRNPALPDMAIQAATDAAQAVKAKAGGGNYAYGW
jgi:hypothetical protein